MFAAAFFPSLASAQTSSRFQAACLNSALRQGEVSDAKAVIAGCQCAQQAYDRNGVGESTRDAYKMYVQRDGVELFDFRKITWLWAGDPNSGVDVPYNLRNQKYADAREQGKSCMASAKMFEGYFIDYAIAGESAAEREAKEVAKTEAAVRAKAAYDAGSLKRLRPARRFEAPEYPPASIRAGEQGEVVVALKLNDKGQPVGYALVANPSGSKRLEDAVMKAVTRGTFLPGQGTDGEFDGFMVYSFALAPEPPVQGVPAQ